MMPPGFRNVSTSTTARYERVDGEVVIDRVGHGARSIWAVLARGGEPVTVRSLRRAFALAIAARPWRWRCLTCTHEGTGPAPHHCPECTSEHDASHGPHAIEVAS